MNSELEQIACNSRSLCVLPLAVHIPVALAQRDCVPEALGRLDRCRLVIRMAASSPPNEH
jgi:hypothetical protein